MKDIPENDTVNKTEEIDMSENIEMEMSELKEFVKTTVSEMITDQETVEKVEAGEAAVRKHKIFEQESQNLKHR